MSSCRPRSGEEGEQVGEDQCSPTGLAAGALVLIVLFMAGEVVFGLVAGSLALLADAGHMLTDAAALALAIVASRSRRGPRTARWTFGLRALEILAAQTTGSTLLLVGVWIVYGAVRRLISRPTSAAGSCSPSRSSASP